MNRNAHVFALLAAVSLAAVLLFVRDSLYARLSLLLWWPAFISAAIVAPVRWDAVDPLLAAAACAVMGWYFFAKPNVLAYYSLRAPRALTT